MCMTLRGMWNPWQDWPIQKAQSDHWQDLNCGSMDNCSTNKPFTDVSNFLLDVPTSSENQYLVLKLR